jgi:hypothetical protein
MERQPYDPDEHEPEEPLSGEAVYDPAGGERLYTVSVEFGHLDLIPPEGTTWDEWVITCGIEHAMQEDQPIDDRTASYVAGWLAGDLTPALRDFVLTGSIDGPGMQEELVHSFFAQTQQLQGWIDWLGHYCVHRVDRGPVGNWRENIDRQDRARAEQVRRERLAARTDALFDRVPTVQRVGNAGKPGWHGLVWHEGRAGGYIVSEGEAGKRRVWETDSDAELEAAYAVIVEAQRQWIVDTWGGAEPFAPGSPSPEQNV